MNTRDSIWTRVRAERMDTLPQAGWKLHVSSTPAAYEDMLRTAEEVLHFFEAPWKTIASVELLEELNDGRFGLAQVGKALTIYPADEAEAVEIAAALAGRLRGMPGPAIITDRRYDPSAPVYFRYGPYGGRVEYDLLGRKHRLLQLPDGTLVRDMPGSDDGRPKPGLLPDTPPSDHLGFLRERFLPAQLVAINARGVVLVAAPRDGSEAVLVKTARRDAQADAWGRDAIWALQREHETLQQLEPLGATPPAGEFVAAPDGSAAAIIRPWFEGDTLMSLWQRPGLGKQAIADVLDQLSEHVARIHEAGYIVRDLSPANVLQTDDRVLILDVELAHAAGDPAPPFRRGTLGFYDPSRPRHAAPAAEDDAYGLRALHRMSETGIHPQWETATPFEFSMEKWRGHITARVRAFIEAPLDTDHANMFSGVAGELFAYRFVAQKELDDFDSKALAAQLCKAAELLRHIPGLYCGAPGIGLALLPYDSDSARHYLLDEAWRSSPVSDLCHGLAGYAAALMLAHDRTGDDAFLERAHEAAQETCSRAIWEHAACSWAWPQGPYAGLSGSRQFGYAHGAAGIVAVLSQVFEATQDPVLARHIRGGLGFLRQGARRLDDGAEWWPVSEDDETCWNAWSHGTPGLVKAFCAARRALGGDDVPEVWLYASLAGVRACNNAGYCLCHGIASRLDAYVDAAKALGADQPDWLAAAAQEDAGRLRSLDVFALEARERQEAGDDGYGLLKGAAGVVLTLAEFDKAFDSAL